MALSFTAPDYLTRAQAGLPLDPSDPSVAPPPVAPPAAATPAAAAPMQPYKPSFLDILQGVLFDGQSPAEAAMAARGRNYQAKTMQFMAQALQSAPPAQRLAMLLNPAKMGEEWAKNFAPFSSPEGSTVRVFGGGEGGGVTSFAPKFGVDDKSGRGFVSTPLGTMATGPSLGGDFSAKDGVISSGRTGDVAATYSLPEIVPAGSSGLPFTPSLGGGGGAAGAPGASAATTATASAPSGPSKASTSIPRGLRNNNFGNLKPLADGRLWPGQTGVDADGYAVFATPQDGVRNALSNLKSYAAQGINTPATIAARWAPAGDGKNDPKAYAGYLAGKLGVHPNDPVDMSDPGVQQKLLRGIFDFENGPTKMAAWRGPKIAPASSTTASGGFGAPFVEGKQPALLSPAEVSASGFPKGTVVERAPNGTLSVVQKPEYSPEAKSTIRDHVLSSDAYKQAKASMAAYQAMVANANSMTGPSAYSMLDTFARAINPGAVARPTVIETIQRNLGLPAQLVGGLESKFGKGNLPPQVRQQIIDAVVPFAQAHWDQANLLNGANAALAKQHGFDPSDVTAPLESRPERLNITVPPPGQRKPGLYATPKGPMKWTGTGWLPAN